MGCCQRSPLPRLVHPRLCYRAMCHPPKASRWTKIEPCQRRPHRSAAGVFCRFGGHERQPGAERPGRIQIRNGQIPSHTYRRARVLFDSDDSATAFDQSAWANTEYVASVRRQKESRTRSLLNAFLSVQLRRYRLFPRTGIGPVERCIGRPVELERRARRACGAVVLYRVTRDHSVARHPDRRHFERPYIQVWSCRKSPCCTCCSIPPFRGARRRRRTSQRDRRAGQQ